MQNQTGCSESDTLHWTLNVFGHAYVCNLVYSHKMVVKPKPPLQIISHAAEIFGELKVLGMHLGKKRGKNTSKIKVA